MALVNSRSDSLSSFKFKRAELASAEPINPGYPGSEDTTHTPWRPSLSWNLSKSSLFRSSSSLQRGHIAVSRRTVPLLRKEEPKVCMVPVRTQGPCDIRFRRFIDFASATSEDLDLLTAACDPATFGRGNEDVYDESYRKAVKMDASNFSSSSTSQVLA
jgi:hypothetical protein